MNNTKKRAKFHHNVDWNVLPEELWHKIFLLLDDQSLLALECVSKLFNCYIKSSTTYKQKCIDFLDNIPDLRCTFQLKKFQQQKNNSEWCKRFYFQLKNFNEFKWGRYLNENDQPEIKIFNTLDPYNTGTNLNISERWKSFFNYSGVYDSVWIPERNLFICSVYSYIQVWDMNNYKCINNFNESLFDTNHSRTTCFNANKDILAIASDIGEVKIFNVYNGNLLDEKTLNTPYICDINIYDTTLVVIDCHCIIYEMSIDYDGGKLEYIKQIDPPISDINQAFLNNVPRVFRNRLIDINEYYIACISKNFIIIFDRVFKESTKTITAISSSEDILCCKLTKNKVFWSGGQGKVFYASIIHNQVQSLHHSQYIFPNVVTRFKDNVTSISVDEKRVIIGDINSEIHVCKHESFKKTNEGGKPDFIIESGHEFGSYIWALKIDGFRIFSGDSDSKLVVHDFWKKHFLDE